MLPPKVDKTEAVKRVAKRQASEIRSKRGLAILGKRSMPNSAEDSGGYNSKTKLMEDTPEKKKNRKKLARDYFSDSNPEDLQLKSVSSY